MKKKTYHFLRKLKRIALKFRLFYLRKKLKQIEKNIMNNAIEYSYKFSREIFSNQKNNPVLLGLLNNSLNNHKSMNNNKAMLQKEMVETEEKKEMKHFTEQS